MMRAKDGKVYLGTSEFADACGVTQQAVSNWMRRGTCPEPRVVLRATPVWVLNKSLLRFIKSKRKEGKA